jgi:hypothetical protein
LVELIRKFVITRSDIPQLLDLNRKRNVEEKRPGPGRGAGKGRTTRLHLHYTRFKVYSA